MTIPKLSGLEHVCALGAAGGFGSLLLSSVVQNNGKLIGLLSFVALLVGVGSFVIRGGWRPSISG